MFVRRGDTTTTTTTIMITTTTKTTIIIYYIISFPLPIVISRPRAARDRSASSVLGHLICHDAKRNKNENSLYGEPPHGIVFARETRFAPGACSTRWWPRKAGNNRSVPDRGYSGYFFFFYFFFSPVSPPRETINDCRAQCTQHRIRRYLITGVRGPGSNVIRFRPRKRPRLYYYARARPERDRSTWTGATRARPRAACCKRYSDCNWFDARDRSTPPRPNEFMWKKNILNGARSIREVAPKGRRSFMRTRVIVLLRPRFGMDTSRTVSFMSLSFSSGSDSERERECLSTVRVQ